MARTAAAFERATAFITAAFDIYDGSVTQRRQDIKGRKRCGEASVTQNSGGEKIYMVQKERREAVRKSET